MDFRSPKRPTLAARRSVLHSGRGGGFLLPLLAFLHSKVECGGLASLRRKPFCSPSLSVSAAAASSPPSFESGGAASSVCAGSAFLCRTGTAAFSSRSLWQRARAVGRGTWGEVCGNFLCRNPGLRTRGFCGIPRWESRRREGAAPLSAGSQAGSPGFPAECLPRPVEADTSGIYFERPLERRDGGGGAEETRQGRRRCSPWHELPLLASPSAEDGAALVDCASEGLGLSHGEASPSASSSAPPPLLHLVVEVPLGETRKNEIMTRVPFNPIQQDRFDDGKKGRTAQRRAFRGRRSGSVGVRLGRFRVRVATLSAQAHAV